MYIIYLKDMDDLIGKLYTLPYRSKPASVISNGK